MRTIVRCAIWLVGVKAICAVRRWRCRAFRWATAMALPMVAVVDAEHRWRWIEARTALGQEIDRRHTRRLVRWLARRPTDPRRRRAVPSEFATMGQPGEEQ